MEKLLQYYGILVGMTESIKHELTEISNKGSNNISSFKEIGNVLLDKLKEKDSYVNDKTEDLTQDYKQTMEQEFKSISMQLQKDLFVVRLIVDKLNIALSVLPDEIRQVIEFKYFNNLTWPEIERKLSVSKHQGQTMRDEGIKRLQAVSRITVDQYNSIKELLNL